MDNRTLIALVIAAVVLIVVGALLATSRKRRSMRLRERFGPEYEQVLLQQGDVRHAEAVLADREKRVGKFTIRSLSRADRDRYAADWANVQRRFVDDPAMAVSEADALLTHVMAARGYPMADFEQRAADISVNYPAVVQNYRAARVIVVRHGAGQSNTEDLRQAMVHYRSLFDELLDAPRAEVAADLVHERIAS